MDDTYLWSHDVKRLQATLTALEKQLAQHGLTINPKKTAIMYSDNVDGGRFLIGGDKVQCLPYSSVIHCPRLPTHIRGSSPHSGRRNAKTGESSI